MTMITVISGNVVKSIVILIQWVMLEQWCESVECSCVYWGVTFFSFMEKLIDLPQYLTKPKVHEVCVCVCIHQRCIVAFGMEFSNLPSGREIEREKEGKFSALIELTNIVSPWHWIICVSDPIRNGSKSHSLIFSLNKNTQTWYLTSD